MKLREIGYLSALMLFSSIAFQVSSKADMLPYNNSTGVKPWGRKVLQPEPAPVRETEARKDAKKTISKDADKAKASDNKTKKNSKN